MGGDKVGFAQLMIQVNEYSIIASVMDSLRPEGDHSEMAAKLLSVYGRRRCNLGQCVAYLERAKQSSVNVALEVLVDNDLVNAESLKRRKGFCRATGSDVTTGSDCGVGDERFLIWAREYLREGTDGYHS